jgi:NNP family nitrate/nitrite transporter-like MFS transporter
VLGLFAVCLGFVAVLPPVAVVVVLLFFGMGMLGMGNGAIFQMVPQRFPDRIGVVTGVVGAAGGLGGFFLPTLLGALRDVTGTYATGLAALAAVFVIGTIVFLELGARWSERWSPAACRQAGVYSYRVALRRSTDERAA